jgi:hypothetical protein
MADHTTTQAETLQHKLSFAMIGRLWDERNPTPLSLLLEINPTFELRRSETTHMQFSA